MSLPPASAADNPTSSGAEAPAPLPNVLDLAPVASATRSPDAATSHLPQPLRWSTRTKILAVVGVLVVVCGASGAYMLVRDPFQRTRTDLVTHRVHYERLELNIVERGALESAKNSDIYCTVKAGTKNSTVATTIKWVIDDGSSVKKGDLLVDLDDSGLQEQLKTQKITLDSAEADKVKAEEDFKIQKSQNESDIKTAEVNLELAEIDLKKYKEGDYPQQLKIFEGNIKQAESDVEQQRDRVAWANRMVKKGYLTVTQAQGEQSKMESLEIVLAKALEDRRVLTNKEYGTGKRETTFRENNVAEAKRALDRVKSQAHAKEIQARSVREAKKSIYLQELSRFKEIEDEIRKCKIYAPQDGMVVYYVPEQARGGGGAQQAIVAQGEPVREGQKLMQIPDLRAMLVNTKVHEALVSRVSSGKPARVRVDSFPDLVLPGHVEVVATVSSQQDFFSADVKVYTTKVMIDRSLDGLKPGMSAEVTITVADALERVLTVPIQAIVGGAEMGKQRKCYVVTAQGPQERDIVVGQSNEKLAEIKQGLKEGDEVVLNPRILAGDKAKVRQPGKGRNEASPGGDGATPPSPPSKDQPKGARPAPDKARGPNAETSGDGAPSPEERQKRQQEMTEKFRKATPEERKQMLEQIPETFRDKVREKLKEQGLEVK
jgi:multidrug resistance efflux pump